MGEKEVALLALILQYTQSLKETAYEKLAGAPYLYKMTYCFIHTNDVQHKQRHFFLLVKLLSDRLEFDRKSKGEFCKRKDTSLIKAKRFQPLENRFQTVSIASYDVLPSMFILISLSALRGVRSILLSHTSLCLLGE